MTRDGGQLALFDYDQLAPEIRDEVQVRTKTIRARLQKAAEDIVAIGGELLAVKAALDHGQFGTWLATEFGWTVRMAQRFMTVHDQFKSVNLHDVQFGASALYALASPSVPSTAREEAVERAVAGERITHKAATEIIDQHRAPTVPARPPSLPDPAEDDVDPGFWECAACGDLFEQQVWHCETCGHHWLVGVQNECANCAPDAVEPTTLRSPTERHVASIPPQPVASIPRQVPFPMPVLEEESEEERFYYLLSKMTLSVRLDPEVVLDTCQRPDGSLPGFEKFLAWLEHFVSLMRSRVDHPIRITK